MKILFISCYSPAVNSSASIRLLYYLNELANIEGNVIHLATMDFSNSAANYDSSLLSLINSNVVCHTIKPDIIYKVFSRKKGKTSSLVNNGGQNKNTSWKRRFVKLVKDKFLIPDQYIFWSWKAYRYCCKIENDENFDAIISMHEPPSAHLIAYLLKRKFKKLKWISYWSDPWLGDFSRLSYGRFRKMIESKLERAVVNISDKLFFTSEQTREEYNNKYGISKNKTKVVYRGYDRELLAKYKNLKPSDMEDNAINIVQAGEIYPELRDITPFINALKKMQENDPNIYNNLRIHFLGNIYSKQLTEHLSDINHLKYYGRVEYDICNSYIFNSDILIVFGNKGSTQIPGKIYDFFGTSSYIFVILGDENDPIKDIAANRDKCILSDNNEDEIYLKLKKLISKINEKTNLDEACPIKDFEWTNIINDLYQKILR